MQPLQYSGLNRGRAPIEPHHAVCARRDAIDGGCGFPLLYIIGDDITHDLVEYESPRRLSEFKT
jgi:hypothetical protein